MVVFEDIIQIVEGLLPAAYSAGDSVISYYGAKTAKIPFYVNIFKLCFVSLVFVYIGYLYLYKGERYRESDNLLDFCLLIITLILTMFAIYFSYHNIKKEEEKNKQAK